MLICSRLILGFLSLMLCTSLYCSSACIDSVLTCNSTAFGVCTVCAVSIYGIVPSAGACVLLNQTEIIQVDLKTPIDLSGFTSSSLAPFPCGSYQLSGQYGSGDYLQKQYDTTPPHYLLKLRFNLAFMGTWGTTDAVIVSVDGVPLSLVYSCVEWTTECTPTDCIRIREANFTHIGSTALVKFTSTSVQPKSVASWGLMNLMVVAKTCDTRCSSCFGATFNDCYTCASGYFLLGNACLDKCPLLAIPNINLCAVSCPNNYYKVQSSMSCQPCSMGCNTCSGPLDSDCIVEDHTASAWDRKKEFWIFLIVFCSLLVLFALACLILRRRATSKIEALNEPMIKPSQPSQGNINNMATRLPNVSSVDFTLEDRVKTVREPEANSDKQNSNSSDSSGDSRKKRKWRGNQQL